MTTDDSTTRAVKLMKHLLPLIIDFQEEIQRTKLAGDILAALIRRPDYVRGPVSQNDAVVEAVSIANELIAELKKDTTNA